MFAARKKKKAVGMDEFEQAIKKVKESKQWDYIGTKEAGVMFA
jgi:ATP-dependent 26S proteasome regulatory subunit